MRPGPLPSPWGLPGGVIYDRSASRGERSSRR
jgi:hypothetical protein